MRSYYHAKNVFLEQSLSIGSNLLVKLYGGTLYTKGKEKIALILSTYKIR